MQEPDLDFLYIGCKEGKCCQCGRTDGKAFSCSGSGISQCVQHVRLLADFRIQTAHLGIAARIVRNRTVGVSGQCYAQCGKHADCSDTDSVKSLADKRRV